MRGARREVGGAWCGARGGRLEARGAGREVRDVGREVRGTRREVRGAGREVRGTWCEAGGARHVVRGGRCEAGGTRCGAGGANREPRAAGCEAVDRHQSTSKRPSRMARSRLARSAGQVGTRAVGRPSASAKSCSHPDPAHCTLVCRTLRRPARTTCPQTSQETSVSPPSRYSRSSEPLADGRTSGGEPSGTDPSGGDAPAVGGTTRLGDEESSPNKEPAEASRREVPVGAVVVRRSAGVTPSGEGGSGGGAAWPGDMEASGEGWLGGGGTVRPGCGEAPGEDGMSGEDRVSGDGGV
ncbi:hypothetical protein J3R03_006104 [Actinoplanes couchii]|nr:hypothetical protein [Actinoplanes couchii]